MATGAFNDLTAEQRGIIDGAEMVGGRWLLPGSAPAGVVRELQIRGMVQPSAMGLRLTPAGFACRADQAWFFS